MSTDLSPAEFLFNTFNNQNVMYGIIFYQNKSDDHDTVSSDLVTISIDSRLFCLTF